MSVGRLVVWWRKSFEVWNCGWHYRLIDKAFLRRTRKYFSATEAKDRKGNMVQFSPVAQSCPTLCDPMNWSTPGLLSITNSRSSLKLKSIESVSLSELWEMVMDRRPGMLRFMGSQRVRHDWATQLNWIEPYAMKLVVPQFCGAFYGRYLFSHLIDVEFFSMRLSLVLECKFRRV